MKAREHKCVNDCCYGEQESYWMAPLPPSSLPSELSFCLFRLCTVSHTDVIPHAGKAKFGRSVTLSIFGIWGFFEIWGLVALYTFEYRSSSFIVVLPPPSPHDLLCHTSDVFPISNTWMIPFSRSFFSSLACSLLTLFISSDKALSVKNYQYNRAVQSLEVAVLEAAVQCENSNTCCVSSCKDHFFIEMVMIPMQLEISVSNTFSVEVHHTVLVFESEIWHITSSIESENASCWSLKLLTVLKENFY